MVSEWVGIVSSTWAVVSRMAGDDEKTAGVGTYLLSHPMEHFHLLTVPRVLGGGEGGELPSRL